MVRVAGAWTIAAALLVPLAGAAAPSQAAYELPEPYAGWERAYLEEFPQLQLLVDEMIGASAAQLPDPSQDVLHNRVCAALAYRMAIQEKASAATRRLAVATDLLHNISKEDKAAVLTDGAWRDAAMEMIARLRRAGYLKRSERFLADAAALADPKVGANLALVHHVTGAVTARRILARAGGWSPSDVDQVQDAILAHSTGYWYFRASVDGAAGRKGAWENVYPEPESAIARYAHDADLVSQFVPESVIPEGSKWRVLAKKRWGATTPREEAHVVYHVFDRLLAEARTPAGKELALEKWRLIRPPLLQLMGLGPDDDPARALGVPKAFQHAG